MANIFAISYWILVAIQIQAALAFSPLRLKLAFMYAAMPVVVAVEESGMCSAFLSMSAYSLTVFGVAPGFGACVAVVVGDLVWAMEGSDSKVDDSQNKIRMDFCGRIAAKVAKFFFRSNGFSPEIFIPPLPFSPAAHDPVVWPGNPPFDRDKAILPGLPPSAKHYCRIRYSLAGL